jgi:hypothetical protein
MEARGSVALALVIGHEWQPRQLVAGETIADRAGRAGTAAWRADFARATRDGSRGPSRNHRRGSRSCEQIEAGPGELHIGCGSRAPRASRDREP